VAANRNLEYRHIYLLRDVRPVPAHEETVVRGEDAAIENLERRLHQGWSRALKDHFTLLRVGRDQVAPRRPARQAEIDEAVGHYRKRRGDSAKGGCTFNEMTTARLCRA
jgi:hypothetical protein